MISLPIMKQTIRANGVLWLTLTILSALFLSQFAAMEVAQNMLFTIYYNMMVLIFPVIFILISSNKLLAKQVDSGSMAYILSTPVGRKKLFLLRLFYQ